MSLNQSLTIEVNTESFQRDVLERSQDTLVVVDFWAAWCQPCRMLAPVLEKLANEFGGRFLLVKANTETVPEVASAFGVQSIPAVFGVQEGKIVDHFTGVMPEASIRSWIEGLLPTPVEQAIAEGRRLEVVDPRRAESCYQEALKWETKRPEAIIGLARLALSQGRVEQVQELLASLDHRGVLEPEVEKLKAELVLQEQGRVAGGLEAAQAAANAHPDNLEARYRLAEALASAGQHVEALDLCLDLVERDRRGVGESARQTMLTLFQVLPTDSPIVSEYRRKLSFIL